MDQSSDMLISNLSVLENIVLTDDKEELEYAKSLLVKYGLESLINHNVEELSGGEKRLVCLMRCKYSSAPILLIDEPSNDLDIAYTEFVMAH